MAEISAKSKLGIELYLDRLHLREKNMIPYDKASPFNPSGLRLGTPAITTRGFGSSEVKVVGEAIAKVLKDIENITLHEKIKQQILELVRDFQVYPGLRV